MNDLELRISALTPDSCVIKIVEEVELTDAVLYIFEYSDSGDIAAAIVYNDQTLFHLRDWQSGRCPKTESDIKEFDWVTEDGRPGIILNGLPRIFA